MKSIAEIADGLRSGRGFSVVPPGTAMSFFIPCMEGGRLTERAFIYPFTPGRPHGCRPYAWIVRSMKNKKLLAYQKCEDRDFMEGGYEPGDRVDYRLRGSVKTGEYSLYCKRFAGIYEEIKNFVFQEELDGQKAGLLGAYAGLLERIIPEELMPYYEGLSPEFFLWIRRKAKKASLEFPASESSVSAASLSWQIPVIGNGISMSLLIPYIKGNKRVDRAFLYSCTEKENGHGRVSVLPYAWLEINSETGKVVGFWQREYRDFDKNGYGEILCRIPSLAFPGREKEIMSALGEMRKYAFEKELTDEQKRVISLFKEIFYGMIDTDLLQYYQGLSPEFFTWLEGAGGMMG